MRRAGEKILEECAAYPIRGNPKFRITSSHSLPCEYVAHLIIPNDTNYEETTINLLNVFKTVDEMEQSTIAIPAIGTGNK